MERKDRRVLNGRAKRQPRGYILEMETKHVRFMPKESRHAFAYPLVYVLVDLEDLEEGRLEIRTPLGLRLFAYDKLGLLSVRPEDYLRGRRGGGDQRSIRSRLLDQMMREGYERDELERDRILLLTMPRLLNYAFNPVSFYYIYDSTMSRLKFVLLEVNNTFDERHLYINKVGECSVQTKEYDLVWTFRRQFHVSPFNDRLGYYQTKFSEPLARSKVQPRVSIALIPPHRERRDEPSDQVKLLATLAGKGTDLNSRAIMSTLARWPFDLFLTFPRIILQAWKLQYRKGLDVFPKPDPLLDSSVGLKWQEMTSFERRAQDLWVKYLQGRVDEERGKISMKLTFADDSIPEIFIVSKQERQVPTTIITLTCLSPAAFVDFWNCESPREAYLLGNLTENRWSVDRIMELEELVGRHSWTLPQTPNIDRPSFWQRLKRMLMARQRRRYNSWTKSFARDTLPLKAPAPFSSKECCHPVDVRVTLLDCFYYAIYCLIQITSYYFFILIRARFQPGLEPWAGWERYRKVELARQRKR